MILIDSHCHLFFKELLDNMEEVMQKAERMDVRYMLSVATEIENIHTNLDLADKYDNVFCSVGVHPSHYGSSVKASDIIPFIHHKKVVAIGEVGLDYYYQKETPIENQVSMFQEMLAVSEHCDLPYIIHARDCFPDILDIMSDFKNMHGVFHCYTGNVENAKKILDKGFYISFSGIVTFKNSNDLCEVLRYIPDDRLLIETDAPYLAPQPFRGKTNEPSYVRLVAEKVAVERKMELEKVANISTSNFFKLFTKAKLFIGDSAYESN